MNDGNFHLHLDNFRRAFGATLLLCTIFFAAGKTHAQNADYLMETIRRGTDEQKRNALSQIRNAGNADASRLAVPALTDASEIVRATAAFAVIYLPSDEAIRLLITQLTDKKPLVRRETAYALGKVGDANAVAALVRSATKDKILEVRNAAIVALGQIGDAAAVNDLTAILQRNPDKKNSFERRAAARAIGQIAQIIQTGRTQVVTPRNYFPVEEKLIFAPRFPRLRERFPVFESGNQILISVLQNLKETADVRREAAFALGAIGAIGTPSQIGGGAAETVLRANLDSEDYYLAEICREALLKFDVIRRLFPTETR